MSVAVNRNAYLHREHSSLLVRAHRYAVLETLAQGRRADVLIGVEESAASLERMVVIKRFHCDPAGADWVCLVTELELSRQLDHDNVVRTHAIALEGRHYCMVKEFVEGTTLQACLDCAAATQLRFPNTVIARILLAILDAVRHADREAKSALTRSFVHAPVAADDVFITYDGQVKLLGFKSAHGRFTEGAFLAQGTAIDALLEQQLTPELRVVLRALPQQASGGVSDRAEGIRQALHRWCAEELRSDGRPELTRLMRNVRKHQRARQALRLVSAFAKLRAPFPRVSEPACEEPAPRSAVRRVGIESSQGTPPRSPQRMPSVQPPPLPLASMAQCVPISFSCPDCAVRREAAAVVALHPAPGPIEDVDDSGRRDRSDPGFGGESRLD